MGKSKKQGLTKADLDALPKAIKSKLPDKFTLAIGALCEPLIEQLREQKIQVHNSEMIEHYQRDMDYIVWLSSRGLITDTERRAIGGRVMDNVKNWLVSQMGD